MHHSGDAQPQFSTTRRLVRTRVTTLFLLRLLSFGKFLYRFRYERCRQKIQDKFVLFLPGYPTMHLNYRKRYGHQQCSQRHKTHDEGLPFLSVQPSDHVGVVVADGGVQRCLTIIILGIGTGLRQAIALLIAGLAIPPVGWAHSVSD